MWQTRRNNKQTDNQQQALFIHEGRRDRQVTTIKSRTDNETPGGNITGGKSETGSQVL